MIFSVLIPNIPSFQCLGKRLRQLKYMYFQQLVEIPRRIMKRLVILLLLVLFFLTIPPISKALPVLTLIPFDQRASDNRLMMVDSLTGVSNYIFSSMFPGGQPLGLAFDLYNDLYGLLYPSESVNNPNMLMHMVTLTGAPSIIGEIGYNAMGFTFDLNDGFFSSGHVVKESAYLQQRVKINLSTGEDGEVYSEEPGPAPALVSIPATVLLLGSGLIGIIGFKRRSKRLSND